MAKYAYTQEERALIEKCGIPVAIFQVIDGRLKTLATSEVLAEALGLSVEQAIDRMDNDMFKDTHPDDVARVIEETNRFAKGEERYETVYRNRVGDGYHIIRCHGNHITKPGGARLCVVWYSDEGPFFDADTDLKESYGTLLSKNIREKDQTYSLKYDYLTGTPGMSYFFELAEEATVKSFENGKNPVILFTDLTGMKLYNQKYGFAAGDKLIKAAADVIVKRFGNENCSRFTADHFAIFTEDDNLDTALEELIAALKDVVGGNSLPARVGVYKIPSKDTEIGIACDRAKMACDSGRSGFSSAINYFDDEMLKKQERRQYIINNLDKALEEGWIKVYNQPIVRATSGRVCDEEALARWVDPVMGMMHPDEFVPILEDARIIHKLDLFVARKVLEKMKTHRENGLHVVPVSVNLSRADFYNCDIVEEIRKLLDESGTERRLMVVEVTESLVGSDIEYMGEQIKRFQDLGIKVWMDDYGSGYSSPELLQHIHFDTIKFDMQFLKEFYTGNESKIIMTELIRMAIGLGIDTVAEGVEHEDQAEFLKEIGCSKLQGFYYLEPIELDCMLERYKQGIQIGFEDPADAGYYDAMGKESLYNLSVSMDDKDEPLVDFFNTMPMAVIEVGSEECWITRANKSYKEFFAKNFNKTGSGRISVEEMQKGREKAFMNAMLQCRKDGQKMVLEEFTEDGRIMHVFIKKIATSPVTGNTAFSVVILNVVKEKADDTGVTFSYIARTITEDFLDLVYVDLESDKFVEYGGGDTNGDLNIEKRGENFFSVALEYGLDKIYVDDIKTFKDSFKKETILAAIEDHGYFALSFRVKREEGPPVYMNIKALRVKNKPNGIILGISNIDAQKKREEFFERIREERITYSRIAALSGDYFVIYSVDPNNFRFNRYVISQDLAKIGGNLEGVNFFEHLRRASEVAVYPPDQKMFLDDFTKENVMDAISNKGVYENKHRVVINGEPVHVILKAAMAKEPTGLRLIVGMYDVDEQTKMEASYKERLLAARNEAVTDALTGVKNKYAYELEEKRVDKLINEHIMPPFAVVVMDINGLKQVNDRFGHQAGDEFLIKGCNMICDIFRHCPIYRVGGDEFVAVVKGRSYKNLDKLMDLLEDRNREHMLSNDIVIAGGAARFDSDKDMASMFARADSAMYENKKRLKELKITD